MIRQASRNIWAHSALGSIRIEIAPEGRQRSVSLVEFARIHDSSNLARAIEELLVIGGKMEFIDFVGQRLLLARFQVKAAKRGFARSFLSSAGRACSCSTDVVNLAFRAGFSPVIRPSSIGKERIRPAIPSRSMAIGFLPCRRASVCSLAVVAA